MKITHFLQGVIKNRSAFFFWLAAISSLLLINLFTSLTVTYDSQFYLASAKAISQGQIASHYFWARTPGYPIFLSAVHSIFGNKIRAVTILQSIILLGSLIILVRQLVKISPRVVMSRIYIFAGLLCLLPTYIGYSQAILQQSLLISLTNLLIASSLRTVKQTNVAKNYILFSIILMISVLVSPVMMLIGFTLVLLFEFRILRNKENLGSVIGKVCLCGLICLVPALAASESWSVFVHHNSRISPAYNQVSEPGLNNLLAAPEYFMRNPERGFTEFLTAFSDQASFQPSKGFNGSAMHQNLPPLYENQVQGMQAFAPGRSCGLVDWVGYAPWVKYSSTNWGAFCSLAKMPIWIFRLLEILSFLFPFVFVMWPLMTFFALRQLFSRNRMESTHITSILILPSAALLFAYLMLGAQPDRYALPAYGPIVLAIPMVLATSMKELN